jgi:hypothetical protein
MVAMNRVDVCIFILLFIQVTDITRSNVINEYWSIHSCVPFLDKNLITYHPKFRSHVRLSLFQTKRESNRPATKSKMQEINKL